MISRVQTFWTIVSSMFAFVAVVWAFTLGSSAESSGNFQQRAYDCYMNKDLSTKACKDLIKFGVIASMYMHNDEYRKKVDSVYRENLQRNLAAAPHLAEFTLEFLPSTSESIAADIIEKLIKLKNESKDSKE